jgi:hypothetical protein
MEKDEIYNQLLDKVQQAGGFLRIKPMERPCVLLRGEKTDRHVIVAALFVSNDDSSPLRLVTNRFTAWDVYDYLDAEDIEHLSSRI